LAFGSGYVGEAVERTVAFVESGWLDEAAFFPGANRADADAGDGCRVGAVDKGVESVGC
jgi:hypothetical protein